MKSVHLIPSLECIIFPQQWQSIFEHMTHRNQSLGQKRWDLFTKGYRSDVLFLSKCYLGVRQGSTTKKKKHKSDQFWGVPWLTWDQDSCLQWNSLQGKMEREMIPEQGKRLSSLSSSSLFFQGLEVFKSTQNKRPNTSSLHWLWHHSWVSPKHADPTSAMSSLMLQIVANLGNLQTLAGCQHFGR